MFFNSYEFIFIFLPIALIGYFIIGKIKNVYANLWLAVLSLFFCAYWDIRYLPVLLGSIIVNYLCSGVVISARNNKVEWKRKTFFWIGILFNIGLLGWYKYMNFFIDITNTVVGAHFPMLHLILPLGISFFSITQILYQVDCYYGVAKDHNLISYVLFVSFFPHLMAGPILYHKPMMAQFADPGTKRLNWENIYRGLVLFIIGLAKKILIADGFSAYVGVGFNQAANLTLLDSWAVALCYLMQIYFDFSGYSDMAVGIARMMNIKIPLNFNSPYLANNLINFWQRWHISLTNAMTACVYMPLMRAFKKLDFKHMVFASFITFFIVGIWHGAGMTYVVYACMHSVGVVINHVWKHKKLWMPSALSHVITIVFVTVGMVVFRSADLHQAGQVIGAMFGFNGVLIPAISGVLPSGIHVAAKLGRLIICTLLIIYIPASQKFADMIKPKTQYAIGFSLLFIVVLCNLTKVTEFIYGQF